MPNDRRRTALGHTADDANVSLAVGTSLSDTSGSITKPAACRVAERRISTLQLRLLRADGRAERQRLLDQIFVAEEQLAPHSTELFNRTRTAAQACNAKGSAVSAASR